MNTQNSQKTLTHDFISQALYKCFSTNGIIISFIFASLFLNWQSKFILQTVTYAHQMKTDQLGYLALFGVVDSRSINTLPTVLN